MLAKLELKLKCKEKITYQMSSLFHGALMELLPAEYADYLHTSQLHPYTQHLEYREDAWYWIICGLNKEAVQIILHDVLWKLQQIQIKKHHLTIDIVQRKYEEKTYRELLEDFYEKESDRYLDIHFLSPTAFKQQGRYLFYPDLRCVFQSLMNKYDSAAREESVADADTLEQLCENAQIVRYDLKSVSFSLEGVRIPSFIGKITIKMRGTQTMANFAKMLFRFGEYSGIGIKTALGMGCIHIMERGTK